MWETTRGPATAPMPATPHRKGRADPRNVLDHTDVGDGETLGSIDTERLTPIDREMLARALQYEGRARVIADRGPNGRHIEQMVLKTIEADGRGWRHTIANGSSYQEWPETAATQPKAMAIVCTHEDGTTSRVDTDMAILRGWCENVRTCTVRITTDAAIDEATIAGHLHGAFIDNEHELRRANENDDVEMDHQIVARVRAARVTAPTTAQGDVRALAILADYWLGGEMSRDGAPGYQVDLSTDPQSGAIRCQARILANADEGCNAHTETK